MPDRKYAQRLELECAPNTALRLLFISVVLLSLLCTAALSLQILLKLCLMLFIGAFAWRCWSRRCELGAMPVTLIWDADNRWWWMQDGEETELALGGDTYHSTAMVILNLHRLGSGGRRALVIFPFSIGDEIFRRLRVRLLLEGPQAAEGRQEHPAWFKAR